MALSVFLAASTSSASAPALASVFLTSTTKSIAVPTSPMSRLRLKSTELKLKSLSGLVFGSTPAIKVNRAKMLTVKAFSSDIKGTGPDGGLESVSESDDDEVDLPLPFDKLPLDSKLQQKLEHKMRMKLTKNVRLRRKKIVRKRRMRKKGRWPPSKVSKLKNV